MSNPPGYARPPSPGVKHCLVYYQEQFELLTINRLNAGFTSHRLRILQQFCNNFVFLLEHLREIYRVLSRSHCG